MPATFSLHGSFEDLATWRRKVFNRVVLQVKTGRFCCIIKSYDLNIVIYVIFAYIIDISKFALFLKINQFI